MQQTITSWQLRLPLLAQGSKYWIEAKDAELAVAQLCQRHYTHNPKARTYAFAGVGEKMVLTTANNTAALIWLKQAFRDDDQWGVCCSLFRNEMPKTLGILSSELISDACQLAYNRWGRVRLFTFVNPSKVKSSNPGYCFKKAGFVVCGETKVNKLIILHKV